MRRAAEPPTSTSAEPITRINRAAQSSEDQPYYFCFRRQPESFNFLVDACRSDFNQPLAFQRSVIFARLSPPSNRNFRFFSTLTVSSDRLVSSGLHPTFEPRNVNREFSTFSMLCQRSGDHRLGFPSRGVHSVSSRSASYFRAGKRQQGFSDFLSRVPFSAESGFPCRPCGRGSQFERDSRLRQRQRTSTENLFSVEERHRVFQAPWRFGTVRLNEVAHRSTRFAPFFSFSF